MFSLTGGSKGICNTFYKEVLGEWYLEELLAFQGLNFSYMGSSHMGLLIPRDVKYGGI